MTKIKTLFHIAGAVLVAGLQYPATAQPTARRLDSLFTATFLPGAPGAAVAVVQHHHTVIIKGYGLADMAARSVASARTNFNIGSLTKQFTAFCVLRLASENKLALSDPLSRFFRGLHPVIGKITLRQLLTHSSGIPDHYAYTDTSGLKHATDRVVLQAVLKMDTLYFSSGTRYRYSNTGYCLLGAVIEKVTGMSYPRYLDKLVLKPLGMTCTVVWQAGRPVQQPATGYTAGNGKHFSQQGPAEGVFFSTEADGGLYTSVADYSKWLTFLQKAKGHDREIIRRQRSPQCTIDGSPGLSYGFGWFCNRGTTPGSVYHSGSNGGFRAFVFTIPELGYSVVIFCNQDGIDLEKLVEAVNHVTGTGNNSLLKIDRLVSFNSTSRNFAPCSVIP